MDKWSIVIIKMRIEIKSMESKKILSLKEKINLFMLKITLRNLQKTLNTLIDKDRR